MFEEMKAAWNELKLWEQVALASVCTFVVLVVYGAFLAALERLRAGAAGTFTFGFVLLLFIVCFWTIILMVSRNGDVNSPW